LILFLIIIKEITIDWWSPYETISEFLVISGILIWCEIFILLWCLRDASRNFILSFSWILCRKTLYWDSFFLFQWSLIRNLYWAIYLMRILSILIRLISIEFFQILYWKSWLLKYFYWGISIFITSLDLILYINWNINLFGINILLILFLFFNLLFLFIFDIIISILIPINIIR
jgi:hypothetical protein